MCPGASSFAARRQDARRAKRSVDVDAKAIENRIRYFQKEEEKVWRELEEVRRRAAAIEGGRSRTLEKRMADRAIQQERSAAHVENWNKVASQRSINASIQERNAAFKESTVRQRREAAQRQRMQSAEVMQRMRLDEMEARVRNSERAIAIQRAKLDAKARNSEVREAQLARIRREQEADWQDAEAEAIDAEATLPNLEAREAECLQRLQNSRQIQSSVLRELETSLGERSPVVALLRSKQKDTPDIYSPGVHSFNKTVVEEDEGFAPEDGRSAAFEPPAR